jgi:hypothetical protein
MLNEDNKRILANTTNDILTMIIIEKKSPSKFQQNEHFDIIGRVVPKESKNSSFYDVIKIRVDIKEQKISVPLSSCLNQDIIFKQIECLNYVKYVATEILNNVDYNDIELNLI